MVQKAELLYSDRINTYRKLVAIEKEIDTNASENAIKEFVELSIRNRLCQEELLNYNNKGVFLLKHPILITNNLQRELTELLLKSPDAFLGEYKNVELSISRYTSYLNSKKKTEDQKVLYTQNLEKYNNKLQIMSSILKDAIYDKQTIKST